jgi:putative ABC transport system substrate-binding protein
MRRRTFISLLGGAAAWPLAARAQQSPTPVIGFIRTTSADDSAKLVEAFRRGLGEVGYVEGHNVTTEYRYAQGRIDRLPELVADLVRLRVAVLTATGGTQPALAAKAATTTIPIVFTTGSDPITVGLVSGLNRPGGNVTGITGFTTQLGAKRLGLLLELRPNAARVAMLVNPNNPDSVRDLKDVQEAVRLLGRDIRPAAHQI